MRRMKCCFLRPQFCDQGLDPVNCELVPDPQKQFLVMFDFVIEWSTFVAHENPLAWLPHWFRTVGRQIGSKALGVR